MDHYRKLHRQLTTRLVIVFWITTFLAAAAAWSVHVLFDWPAVLALAASLVLAGIMSFCAALIVTPSLLEPVRVLKQAVFHVSPAGHSLEGAPNLDQVRLGRELVTSLSLQVYELASRHSDSAHTPDQRQATTQAAHIVNRLPLPMFVCNKQLLVITASDAALSYCHLKSAELFGKPLHESVRLEFPSELTLESWMADCQANKVTDTAYWERVRVRLGNDQEHIRQCDMAAYYNRDNPSGTEFIITLFDRTERYQQDDQAVNFVALAVHELRTPLTVLRGYIEVFEEELTDNLSPELRDFMHKLQVSAEQLTGFVNNILNVARVEENQLVLSLSEENWEEILRHIVADNELRARVHDKTIRLDIEPGLPTVAVDKVSIYEVVSNLLDNAIKYSAESKEIVITSKLGRDNMIETTVRDYGVGIPANLLPNLFEKFYRNHRTRTQIGGTGLGLYLSKAIITAHGGQVWAESKEGEGSTFGFSLQAYASASTELKDSINHSITRAAHGWVKNHSLYRR